MTGHIMKALSVSLTLAVFLALSRAVPFNNNNNNNNNSSLSTRNSGLCEYVIEQSMHISGAFVPQCDSYGNFMPQQCSTSNCWCVNVITGEEIPNTRTLLGATAVNCDSEFYCPHGWSRFGRQCFVFIDSPKTWAEAEGYCLFEGANLASVHSYEEDYFIQSLTRGDGHDFPHAWIGGHDAIHFSFWMWSDGSKFRYENWHSDYRVERTEHCLKMNYEFDRKWNYGFCDDALPFVCAKRI